MWLDHNQRVERGGNPGSQLPSGMAAKARARSETLNQRLHQMQSAQKESTKLLSKINAQHDKVLQRAGGAQVNLSTKASEKLAGLYSQAVQAATVEVQIAGMTTQVGSTGANAGWQPPSLRPLCPRHRAPPVAEGAFCQTCDEMTSHARVCVRACVTRRSWSSLRG